MARVARAVSTTLTALLVLVAIIGMAERGPPSFKVPTGPSPLNVGELGTFDFYQALRSKYRQVLPAASLSEVEYPRGAEYCLFITISPDKPYTKEEAMAVLEKLRNCKNKALLVADEYTTSNALLEAANLTSRVAGSTCYSPKNLTQQGPVEVTPYVEAVFRVGGEAVRLLLDIASRVEGGKEVLGYAENVVVEVPSGAPSLIVASPRAPPREVPVAVYDYNSDYRAVVIGDGSIFLNQVFRSRYASNYSKVLLYYVDYLCGFSSDCVIYVDASKYESVDPEELLAESSDKLRDPSRLFSVDVFTLVAAYIAKLLHPSTWLMPVLNLANSLISQVLATPPYSYVAVLVLVMLTYGYVVGRIGESARDERLREQKELEAYLTADLISAIASGRYRFDREDFASLYEIVDTHLRHSCRVGLEDPDGLVRVLSGRVEPGKLGKYRKYAEKMNKLYQKALGRKRLPLILSWHRTTKKFMKISEEVLSAVGASLAEERGYEYIAMKGVRIDSSYP
ncbi:MAG: hypothetical protein ACP5KA_04765 [Desulfurococcaceae archaeon]